MKKKRRFVLRFMDMTGKTSAIFGPANRSAINASTNHIKTSPEAKTASSLASRTWDVRATSTGEHYAVELPKEDPIP